LIGRQDGNILMPGPKRNQQVALGGADFNSRRRLFVDPHSVGAPV